MNDHIKHLLIQRQYTEDIKDEAIVRVLFNGESVVEVVGEMGVLYPSTVEEQIAEFEIVFQPALEVIRNVDITGVSRKIAENRFNNYIWLNQPIKTAFLLGYSGTGVPYLSRVLDLYLDIEYGASGYFSGFPLEWVQYGYVIK